MPIFDAELYKGRAEKKHLTLVLSDGEGIINSIKEGMKEHGIKEAFVEQANGLIKSGQITFNQGNRLKSKELVDEKIFRASGKFSLSFDELFGSMSITIMNSHPLSGTLAKGTASEGFQIILSFLEIKP